MHRANTALIVLCGLLLLTSGWLVYERAGFNVQAQDTQEEPEEPELAEYMASLQRYSHKLTLSVQARNAPTADFYLHELEEMNETIIDEVPSYEGHAIGDLTEAMLVPAVEAVERALDDENWSEVDARLGELVQACNQCHQSTDHGFIQIEADVRTNPYNQSFAPSGE